MSYILDALKKAERDRHIAQVPTLATVHRAPAPAPTYRWVWVVAPIVVLNLAALAWFLWPTTTPSPDPAVVAVAPTATPAPPTAAIEPPSQAPPPSANLAPPPAAVPPPPPPPPTAAPAREATPPPAATLEGEVTSPAQARAGVRIPRATDPRPLAATPRPQPPGDAKTSAAPTQSVPPAVADLVPNLQLQAVVYSETPTERLVFINNRKYVEGQTIEGRVLLERITADSVVLSYEGTRFTLSRP